MHKDFFTIIIILVWSAVSCCSIDYGQMKSYQETIAPGIEYQKYQSFEQPLVIHVVKINKENVNVALIPAQGQREEVSLIAQQVQALIAINGGNYRRGGKYNGNRVNLCYIYGTCFSDPSYLRGTVAWNEQSHQWMFDMLTSSISIIFDDKIFPVHGINQARCDNENMIFNQYDSGCILYNPGYNIVVQNGIIQEIFVGTNKIPIFFDGFIYQTDTVDGLKVGMSALLNYQIQTQHTHVPIDVTFALGGAGLLMQQGNIMIDHLANEFSLSKPLLHMADEIAADFLSQDQQELLINICHPRTAIGIDKNHNVYLVVVDGRQKSSNG